jgi:serine/threonine-protein kinase
LLEEAFDSGALVFSEPLLQAVEGDVQDEFSARVQSEHGIVYDIERNLGRGGMASVYLARDPKHDRSIAIKVLHADVSARLGAERFVREIRLTARLQHPHVLGLLDSGVFDENAAVVARRPYYVMPYVEGETLRARLTREGALRLDDAMRVLREVADALCYAHEAGVIHRDIKPENILLTRGHAVVADFGIAKAIAAAEVGGDGGEGGSSSDISNSTTAFTRSSTVLGTPAYMAPEQASAGGKVDHRADLYAWGVVAYETLTGRHPFRGPDGSADLPSGDIGDLPVPIRSAAPSVPRALAALVMRCLARVPAERPDSAAEVLAALDSAVVYVRSVGVVHTADGISTAANSSHSGPERSRSSALPLERPPTWARSTWRGARASLVVAALVAKADYSSTEQHTAVVVGTGNPATDVAAVQAAVDHADTVELAGTFSFRQPPKARVRRTLSSTKFATPPMAEVRVSRPVAIIGVPDTLGGMATIEKGTIPFYVDAPGARVSIRGVRFVKPVGSAIVVVAVNGLEIASNRIDGMTPFRHDDVAIQINTSGGFPTFTDSGAPGDVSGSLSILQNVIDATGGTPAEYALGVFAWSVGRSPDAEVTLEITGNTIINTTASGIMIRRANGHVRILGNTVETATGAAPDATAIRLVNTGSYQMARNTITCRLVDCVGISVFSQVEEWPIDSAIVEDNILNMLPPAGAVFADSSAAIEIKGFAHSNVVRYNAIRGRAHTALAIGTWRLGYPADNSFIDNNLDDFHGSVASTFVGSGVLRTRLVHPGIAVDRGKMTTIER